MVSRNVPSPTGVGLAFVLTVGAVWANAATELTASNTPPIPLAPSHFLHSSIGFLPYGSALRAPAQCLPAFHAQRVELGVAGGGVVEDAPYFVRFFRPVMQRKREGIEIGVFVRRLIHLRRAV